MPLLTKLLAPAIAALSTLVPLTLFPQQPPGWSGAAQAHEAECRAAAGPDAELNRTVPLHRADLGKKFLLQISYERRREIRRDFSTSRSHVVTFVRHGDTVRMVEDAGNRSAVPALAVTIPVRSETAGVLELDFNTGFNKVFHDEDRTGKDYYEDVVPRQTTAFFPIVQCATVNVSRVGAILAIEQRALSDDETVSVHYYLSPYRPNPHFQPFELDELDYFGFYQTYPQKLAGRRVFQATKFDSHKPIVFAISASTPASRRAAVRDGVLYWNRALGRQVVQVIEAPASASVPSAQFNLIEWVENGALASTSHIQGDPLTGEILHAHIFLDGLSFTHRGVDDQDDFLSYVVAHETGHALGLRHNFAKGPPTTVMNYFSPEEAAALGRSIRSGGEALEYDRKVMRHVYLAEPLNVASLPRFCTDYQPGCGSFSDRASKGHAAGPGGSAD